MAFQVPQPRAAASCLAMLLSGFAFALGSPPPATQQVNPIARIARIFDPQLVQIEDRVDWLSNQLNTFARHYEHSLKTSLGYRGARLQPDDPDPTITLDLGKTLPLETIYLIPSQREFLEDQGIFPRKFTLEVSERPDFVTSTVVFRSGTRPEPSPQGVPVAFQVGQTARFVRLTVHEGHQIGTHDLFGLSELMVISNQQPVSFTANVSATGSLIVPGIWFPEALTDGRSPLGIWHNSNLRQKEQPGDAVLVADESQHTAWSLELAAAHPTDYLILFPYQINRSFETSVFPESLEVWLSESEHTPPQRVFSWTNPLAGSSHMTPLVIPLHGRVAKRISITATRPWIMGDRKVHALSEIEWWSAGKNLAQGLPVIRRNSTTSEQIPGLTDGWTSENRIMPVAIWLRQLHERGRIERELASLRPVHHQLASRSELNATWGSAVLLGLTFLIPVFIVERRRLMSKEQLDHIRKRIASDLHDDIGSNLGSISLIARTARKDLARLHGPEEIAEDLSEVETIARESSLAMRDIVWLLERRQDSIGDLVQRMRETANRLLREIHFTLECESNKTAAKLSLDAKRHLFLFYKEAIHNVLKHSRANQVTVRLWDEDDKLALEILDNGIGLPTTDDAHPTSVNKLQDRARVLDGLLQIASSKETGTRIRLLVKRSHLTTQPALS